MNTLTLNLRDVEGKKRILEEAVDTLNEEIAGLKAKGFQLASYPVCLVFRFYFCIVSFIISLSTFPV